MKMVGQGYKTSIYDAECYCSNPCLVVIRHGNSGYFYCSNPKCQAFCKVYRCFNAEISDELRTTASESAYRLYESNNSKKVDPKIGENNGRLTISQRILGISKFLGRLLKELGSTFNRL